MHSTTTERRHSRPGRVLRVLTATAGVALLAACGASAGSDDDPAAGTGTATADEPVVVQKASLAGVAAAACPRAPRPGRPGPTAYTRDQTTDTSALRSALPARTGTDRTASSSAA